MFTFKEDIQSKGTLTFQLPPLFAKSLVWSLKLGLSISLLFFGQSSVSKEARDTLQFGGFVILCLVCLWYEGIFLMFFSILHNISA